MKITDLIYITLQNLKNRKSRFFFTILGVAVAIAVVLSLVSFGYGLQKSLLENITTEESLLALDIFPSNSDVIIFNEAVVRKILDMPNVEKVSPQVSFVGQAELGKVFSEASINVINDDFFDLDGKAPLAGTFFKKNDSKKIVVSSLMAQLFSLKDEEILNKKIKFRFFAPKEKGSSVMEEISFGNDFEIVGVVEGSGITGQVFINKSDFPNLIINQYDFAKVKVVNSNAIEKVRDSLINQGFIVSSLSDTVNQANKIFGAIQLALGIFGIFALIVASIGLINTMTISLLERTNEIGIMRAIGAAPKDIKRIFLVESTVIGFLGGVSGTILGIIVSEFLNWIFNILARSFGGVYTRLFSF